MANIILDALKTGRQVLTTLGILGAAFGMPALMAGGVALSPFAPEDEVVWMGTGGDDPVVHMTLDEFNGTDSRDQEASEQTGEPDAASERGPERISENGPVRTPAQPKLAQVDETATPSRDFTEKTHNRSVSARHGRRVPDMTAKRALRAAHVRSRGGRCEPEDGVEHVYGDRYRMDRDVIDHYTTSIDAAMKLARVAWSKDSKGKKQGFRLSRVRCGSPLALVGLRSGDVIHSINGRAVKSIPQAFTAVRKIKRHDVIRVHYSRGGKRLTKTVQVI